MAKRQTYVDWYDNNKDKISEKRKSKYQTDDNYRQSVLAKNKLYRLERRSEIGYKEIPRIKPRKPLLLEIDIHGRPTPKLMLRISVLSEAIGETVPTLYGWERKGIMPHTPFRTKDAKKERLYTQEMINAVCEVYSLRSRQVASGDVTFLNEIVNRWKSAGVIVNGEN